MARRLFRQERLDGIVQQLKETGYVSVAELSSDFGVSTVTVRTDLDLLEKAGHLLRTHGGAVPISVGESGLSFSVRLRDNVQSKERIGAAAAQFVEDSLGSTSIGIALKGGERVRIFRDGQMIEGYWWRSEAGRIFQFIDTNGNHIPLKPGHTWIQLVPTSYNLGLQ